MTPLTVTVTVPPRSPDAVAEPTAVWSPLKTVSAGASRLSPLLYTVTRSVPLVPDGATNR